MSPKHRLINVVDTSSGLETTIKISRVRHPDEENIVYPREREDIIIHQILGTYNTMEDFNYEWDSPSAIEKKVLCSRCKEPFTYYVPDQNDIVNFISITKTDAKILIDALLEVLRDA